MLQKMNMPKDSGWRGYFHICSRANAAQYHIQLIIRQISFAAMTSFWLPVSIQSTPTTVVWCYVIIASNSYNGITDHSPIKSKLIHIPIYSWFARTSAGVMTSWSDKQVFVFHEDLKYLNHSGINKLLKLRAYHYSDVIIDTMTSQTTSLMTVYSTVCSGADQRKYQSSASLAGDRWIPRTKGQ